MLEPYNLNPFVMMYKAVFLDHDGALLPGVTYNSDLLATELNDEVVEGLQRLQSYGYLLVVVSDQQKAWLRDSCAQLGIYLDGFYCFDQEHHILRACDDLHIDLTHSWMVGDTLNDVEAGNKAGCKSIMINNGNETQWVSGSYRLPEYFARDLSEASRYIVASDNMKASEREKVYA